MKNRTAILILIVLSTVYPIHAQESPELSLIYFAFFPYDTEKTPYLFEEPSYQNIGNAAPTVFEFNETTKNETISKLRELMDNFTGGSLPHSEDWVDRTPIEFRLDDSYFGNPKGQSYRFSIYPDFLVMEYKTSEDRIDNKTHQNKFSYFLSNAMGVNKLLGELGIATSSDYKVIIYCDGNCYTDTQDVNIKTYKDFFKMKRHVKKSASDSSDFILYNTPVWVSRQRDTTVINFNPENELYPVFELKEIIIPYSNERIRYLLEDIDNSTQELGDISENLGRSESTEETDEIIENLLKIGEKGPYYYEELSKFRVLKNKEANFLNDKPNYFQITSGETNKTYEREIKEHISSLEGNIILLDSKIDYWDSLYWHLRDSAMAKRSYQQQEDFFWWQVLIFGVVVVIVSAIVSSIIDIIVRTYEQEIKRRVSPRLNFVKSAVSDLLGKIKTGFNKLVK